MGYLRTVTALEHEVIPVVTSEGVLAGLASAHPWLTEVEAQALLRLNDKRPGFCQRLSGGVRLAQHCGIVRLPTCVVEVLPKVGMDEARTPDELSLSRGALLGMLHGARHIAITRMGPAPQQAVHAPLLDVFIEAFLHCALHQARRGLLSRYEPHVDDLIVVKGKFQAHGHIRRNVARPHLLQCQYDEFTADNAYNRAIRATLESCRFWVGNASTQRLWFETHSRFANISTVKVTADEVARLPRNRTTLHYEPVLTWCEWLLAMASPALSAGASQAPGLLFDMNKLFESYVSNLEESAADEKHIVIRQGPVETLASNGKVGAFALRPDITIWQVAHNGSVGAIAKVIDAKWKRLDPSLAHWGVDQADVYQLLAYALHYGCERLELVYPAPNACSSVIAPIPVLTINGADSRLRGVEIHVKVVPMWMQAASPTATSL